MKIKGLFSALSLASVLVLAACGGGGDDGLGGGTFSIQGERGRRKQRPVASQALLPRLSRRYRLLGLRVLGRLLGGLRCLQGQLHQMGVFESPMRTVPRTHSQELAPTRTICR